METNNGVGSAIYTYSLALHECINDCLMMVDIGRMFFCRVKTREDMDDRIERYSRYEDRYPVNNWINGVFAVGVVLPAEEIESVMDLLKD